MSVILEMLGMLIGATVFGKPVNDRGRDRRLLAENKVRCAIRAADARVLNIGTEWSIGVCEITNRHLKFVPSIGIVGDRDIPVYELQPCPDGPSFGVNVPWGTSAHFVISTQGGDLAWAFPEYITDDILNLLLPDAEIAGQHSD